jgi:hypothetical protein
MCLGGFSTLAGKVVFLARLFNFVTDASGGIKPDTYGDIFYTPILNWTLELLKLRTGVL